MRNPNGYGSVTKMKGTRRKPWRVRVTVGWDLNEETGQLRQVSKTLGYFATKKDAMLSLHEFNANPYDLTNRDITFAKAYEAWSPKYFEQYTGAVRNLKAAYNKCSAIHDMKMIDIRVKHLQDVLDTFKNQSVSAQTQIKTIFIKTFKYCLENDIVNKDYSKFATISQTPIKQNINEKFFTKEEIKAILDHKDFILSFPQGKKSYSDLKFVDTAIILLYSGLRIGELLAIKSSDVDLEKRIIHVYGTKTASAKRIVPIHKNIATFIKNRLAEGNEYLISNANGKPINPVQYRQYFFEPFMKKIGASHTPHALRHTFISIMDNCGVSSSSVVLKRIVGHANASVTEHYTHKDIDQLLTAIDKFEIQM